MEPKLTKKEKEEIKKIEKLEAEKNLQSQKKAKTFGIIAAVVIIITLAVLGLIKLSNSTSQAANIPPVSNSDITDGNKNAKVTLIEYSDFECPACAMYNPIVLDLISQYGKDVLFIYRFFPLPQHTDSVPAAKAAFAAWKQGKFREMEDLLFTNQKDWTGQDNVTQTFEKYAKSLNLNIDQYKKDFNSKEANEKITNDFKGGESQITYTPTFFLNGRKIDNPQSEDEFKKLIKDELNKTN